jgi:integrase
MSDRVRHGSWVFFKQSDVWTVEWWKGGKRFRRTTGTSDWDKALPAAERITRTIDPSGSPYLTLGLAIKRYLDDCKPDLSPHSVRRYTHVLTDMAAWVGEEKPLREVTRRDLKNYLLDVKSRRTLKGELLSKATIRNVQSHMRPFWSWSLDEELIESDIAFKLSRRKKGDKIEARPAPKVEVVDRALTQSKKVDPLIYDWIRVGIGTGLRPGEQAGLTGADLDRKSRMLQVVGKTGSRTIKLNKDVSAVLLRRKLRNGNDAIPLFPTEVETAFDLRNLCKRLKKVTGTTLNLYSLRHYFATHAARRMEIYDLATYLGHGRNVATTTRWYAERRAEDVGAPPEHHRKIRTK